MNTKIFLQAIAILLVFVSISIYIYTDYNKKIELLNNELNSVKQNYATINEVPNIVSERLGSCRTFDLSKNNWNYNSDVVYGRDFCKANNKLCFASTMMALPTETSLHTFGKGDKGCNFALTKNTLDDTEFYTVLCC